jgi:hypothetical protein
MPAPLVLALDLSTRVGWACGRAGGEPDYGVLVLPKGISGHGAIGAALFDALMDLHDVQHFERVIMEAPLPPQSQTSANTARIQFGLAFAVETWCYRRELEVREARPDDWRMAVLGRARFGGTEKAKAAAMAWCHAQGWAPSDDNAADALALWRYATTRPGGRMAA